MPNYKQINAQIQSGWYTCWAASLSWWTHSMSDRGQEYLYEEAIIKRFPFDWDKNGAMTFQGLTNIFNEPQFNMLYRFNNVRELDIIIEKYRGKPVESYGVFPIIIGYKDPNAGGNHIAVLCDFHDDPIGTAKFVTMDPARGYVVRSRDYFLSERMVYAWDKNMGDIIYG